MEITDLVFLINGFFDCVDEQAFEHLSTSLVCRWWILAYLSVYSYGFQWCLIDFITIFQDGDAWVRFFEFD